MAMSVDHARTTLRRLLYLLPKNHEDDRDIDVAEANLDVPLEAYQLKKLRQKVCSSLMPLKRHERYDLVVDLLGEATPYESNSSGLRQERLWRQVLLAPAPHIGPICLDESPSDNEDEQSNKTPLLEAVAQARSHAFDSLASLTTTSATKDGAQAAVMQAKKVLRACRAGLGIYHKATGQAARYLATSLLRMPNDGQHITELQHALSVFARASGTPTASEVTAWLPHLDLWAGKIVLGDATCGPDLAQGRDFMAVVTCCLQASGLCDVSHTAYLEQLRAWVGMWNRDGMAQRPDRRAGPDPVIKARALAVQLREKRQVQAAQRIMSRCDEAQQGSSQNKDACISWLDAVFRLYDGCDTAQHPSISSTFFTHLPLQTSDDAAMGWLHQRRDDFMQQSKNIVGHQHTKNDLFAWALDFSFGHNANPMCLVGSPGIGKSALLNHFCKAFFAPAQPVILDIKGWNHAAVLKGWEQKYVAAQPGELAMALMNRGNGPCVIIFDDIDHAVQAPGQGSSEIQETIGQVMAKEPFTDLFFGFPLNLEKCFFFATANRFDLLAPHLQRRLVQKKMHMPDKKSLQKICLDALKAALTCRHILGPIDDALIDWFVGNIKPETGIAPVLADISDFASFFSRQCFEGGLGDRVYDSCSQLWREASQNYEDPCQHPIYGALAAPVD